MLPEQVWDEPDMPLRHLTFGGPAGSACPLVWAHAEYLKLLRSAVDGRVFDRIDPVFKRYGHFKPEHGHARSSHHGRGHDKCIEMFSLHRPIQVIPPSATLRLLHEKRFLVIWSNDNWASQRTTDSRSMGSAGFAADIVPAEGPNPLSLTFFWPDENRWLGHNYTIRIEE
jgi:glucoamylase